MEQPYLTTSNANNGEAFSQIYRTYYNEMASKAKQFLKVRSIYWDDCVQDTFTALWKAMQKGNHPPHVRNYLYNVLYHRCVDIINANTMKYQEVPNMSPLLVFQDHSVMILKETLNKFESKKQLLTPREYEIAHLLFMAQLNDQEVANLLGTTLANVRSIKSNINKKLKKGGFNYRDHLWDFLLPLLLSNYLAYAPVFLN